MFNCLPISILSLSLIFALSGCAGFLPKKSSQDKEWNKHRLIVTLLEHFYYKEIDRKKCAEAILKGGVSECTDPFTRYIDTAETRLKAADDSGHFGGVGMALESLKKNGEIEIVIKSVKKNLPAEKGGVKPGDVLYAVSASGQYQDLRFVKGLSVIEIVNLIRGRPNSEVMLLVLRAGHYEKIILIREDIKIETVKARPIKKGIGYVQLAEFGHETPQDFFRAVQALEKGGARVLIVDVRNNPGGFLGSVCRILGCFVKPDSGTPLVYTKARLETDNQNHFSIGYHDNFSHLKVVVLANGNSASAAEILTAWFKEDYGAVVVGEKTFGKGSVQRDLPLPDGSKLHFTIAHYLVGKNKVPVHEVGVLPTIEVKGDKDQLARAVAVAEKLLKD